MFVAQGDVGRTAVSYDDGYSWIGDESDDAAVVCFTDGTDCDHHSGAARGLAFGDGWFLATFGWGTPGGIRRSADGIAWEPVLTGTTFGGIAYRGSIVRMGGESVLGVLKDIRQELGKAPGDEIAVTVEPDAEERVVDVPPELAELLQASPTARKAFDALSYSHRREHALHVAEAKKPETRQRRAAKTIEALIG